MNSLTQCTENEQIQTVIITGGHDFERDSFFAMFNSFPDVVYKEVIHPEANKIYNSDDIESVDVLIFYDMVQEISEEQKQDMISLLEKGKSLLFLHHSLASYQEWDEFANIIGGKYHMKSSEEHPGSTYKHDVEVPVQISADQHAITQGLVNFSILDETYGGFTVLPKVYPLLTTEEATSGDIIGWINHYKNSWIVYLQLGHDHNAYENQNFRQLVHQSIQWLADPKP